jgi:hypothetical protein
MTVPRSAARNCPVESDFGIAVSPHAQRPRHAPTWCKPDAVLSHYSVRSLISFFELRERERCLDLLVCGSRRYCSHNLVEYGNRNPIPIFHTVALPGGRRKTMEERRQGTPPAFPAFQCSPVAV